MDTIQSFAVPENDQPIHVHNNAATAFLGVLTGLLICLALVGIASGMGWHPVVGGVLTGFSGAVVGASGSSTPSENRAAILGWAGATNFVLGLVMFVCTLLGIIH